MYVYAQSSTFYKDTSQIRTRPNNLINLITSLKTLSRNIPHILWYRELEIQHMNLGGGGTVHNSTHNRPICVSIKPLIYLTHHFKIVSSK